MSQPPHDLSAQLKYLDDLGEQRFSDVSAASTPGSVTRSPSDLDSSEPQARSSSSPLPQSLPLLDVAGPGENPSFLASPQKELGLSKNFCKADGEEETGVATAVQETSRCVHSKSLIGNPNRSPESIDLFSTVASHHNKKGPSHHHNSSEPSDFRLTMPMKLDETIESFQRSSPVDDSLVYGRENEKNSIIGFLLSNDFNRSNLTVVCIVGESGIGKTSLAHLIYSEERILDSFDARVFITMPEKFDETRLIKKLFESVTISPCPMTEADLLEELLIDELSGTKVFVVLDDADNENSCFWNRIVTILNHCTRGSVLLVTTKSKDVAEVIGAMRTHFLDPLSDYYCWKLFWQHIFTGLYTNANTDLVETGKQLVSKCQHNLLCIKVLAGLLVCLKNVESWVEILKTDLWNMNGFDGDTLPILRVCYETLPDNLKKCLHYCSSFPRDYVFAKQQIVRMWMSQGFIISVERRKPEEVGLQNFDELLLRGFFQHSPLHDVDEDKYIMHDLIRALATHFSRNECASAEDVIERTLVNCFHFSLNPSVIQIDKMKPLIKEASDLQSFLVLSRLQTRINISIQDITSLSDLFTKCINLRTLDLSCTDIVELPSSVGMLKQLRYLGVNNTKIRSIPRELCSLVSLETLEAKDCQHLVELPESMMELTSLRHLDVSKKSGCVKMMIGIGQLTNLQSLAVFFVGCEMPYCSIRELKDLNSLSSCLQIAGLENIRYGLDAKEAALHNKVHLNTLWLHWNDNRTCIEYEESVTISEEVLKNLKPNPNIGELIIRNYRGNLFPTWMGDPSFSKLVSIILDKCHHCSQFPALGGLPSLRHLSVQKLYHLVRLENKDSQFVSKNTPKFPSLETLNLWEMYDLEELFETSDCDFPCLRTLSISRCPMLKSVPCFSSLLSLSLYCCVKLPYLPDFPSLKSFRIDGFKKIKSLELPKDLAALKELEIRHCNELLLVEGLPNLPSLEKLNVVHCPKFDPFKSWKPSHSKSISTTRWFFPKEESTTQVEHEETLNLAEKLITDDTYKGIEAHVCLPNRIGNPSRSPESIDLFSTTASNHNKNRSSHHHNSSEPSHFRLIMPIKSAPGSGFTSPVRNPRRFSSVDLTQGLNIPAAEFLTSGENYVNSPDRSPRSSPLRSPGLPHPPCSLADQWKKGRLIGSGTFGNVFEATNRHTGALCAMKEVNIIPEDAKSIESLKQLQQEIWFLSQYQHPNIVQYYGSEITEDGFYIYLEYVHPGSINKYVRQHYGAMTESVVRNFTRHILSGLAYLHSKKIMHRDIKGANLLVDAKGVVKLADFGMAKSLSEAAPNLSLKGAPYWMAPEVLQATIVKDSGGYDLAVDIWSLGCTLIEMFTGKPPWSGLEGPAAMFKVLHRTPPIPDSLSSEGRDFLQKCFRKNPVERPTAAVLLEHPFIRNASYYNAHGAISPTISATKLPDTTYSPKERRPTAAVLLEHPFICNASYNNAHGAISPTISATCLTLGQDSQGDRLGPTAPYNLSEEDYLSEEE